MDPYRQCLYPPCIQPRGPNAGYHLQTTVFGSDRLHCILPQFAVCGCHDGRIQSKSTSVNSNPIYRSGDAGYFMVDVGSPLSYLFSHLRLGRVRQLKPMSALVITCSHPAAHILRSVIFFASEGVEIPVTQSTWQIIFLATTVFTNIYCTSAIIYGIVSLNGFIKAFRTYHGILEILIESAIMYTAIYLVQIGLDVYTTYFTTKWDTRYFYAQALATVITVCLPFHGELYAYISCCRESHLL